jgi:molecular chaperone DnaK (HSP70)
VAFTDDTRIVGDSAKRQAASNTQRTLFNIKRIIGRHFKDCTEDIKQMPFPVTEGDGGKPVISVEVPGAKGGTKLNKYFPEQISAMVLEKVGRPLLPPLKRHRPRVALFWAGTYMTPGHVTRRNSNGH